MATAQFTAPASAPRRPVGAGWAAPVPPGFSSRSGAVLLLALVLAIAYAAFAHGARNPPEESRLQVALAAAGTLAAAAWLFGGGLRVRAPAIAWVGIGLLTAFAVWSGVTLIWSVAPDRTWIELNRAIAYALVALLALVAGASGRRAGEHVALGYLAVAVLVALYALGGKLAPGVHVAGVFDLNQTQGVARLRAPLDYWNALGLICVLGVPIALTVAVDETRRLAGRLAGAAALQILLVTLVLTYSRGGIVAVIVAVAVSLALGRSRLRSLLWLAAAVLAAVPTIAVVVARHNLTAADISLSAREHDGLLVLGVLLATLVVLLLVGRLLVRAESRLPPNARRSMWIGRGLVAACVVAAAVAVGAVAASPRGLTGSVSHEWHAFTRTRGLSLTDPSRVLSTSSGNRWVWWREAVGAFSDRPLGGWGAGSFPVTHLRYRRDRVDVLQPHSVPLQFLAETGLVGAVLALGGFALLALAAIGTARRLPAGRERQLAAAAVAGVVAFAVHGLFDWDWDIPGVTIPALVLAGVIAGAGRRMRTEDSPQAVPGVESSRFARGLGLVAVTLLGCAIALSATLPAVASSKATTALVQVGDRPSTVQLQRALATAELASRIDPLSDQGLMAAATIAERDGSPLRARGYLLAAVRRDPSDVDAWEALVRLSAQRGDLAGAQRAAQRALALDPHGLGTLRVAATLEALRAPPNASATATGTPLPALPGSVLPGG